MFWEEQFRQTAGSHLAWQHSAATLRRAVNILDRAVKRDLGASKRGKAFSLFTPSSVCMMLSGLMLEDLFKAVLVSRNGAFDAQGNFAHKTHDLLTLAELVGFKFSKEEAWLMERLTQFVQWLGKYPIPLSRHNLLAPPHLDGGPGRATYMIMGSGGDIEIAKQLARRIERMLPKRIRRRRAKPLRHSLTREEKNSFVTS
jgi:hypothetical protein